MRGKLYIVLSVVLLPLFCWSNKDNPNRVRGGLPIAISLSEGVDQSLKLNHKFSLGWGYRNFLLDYQGSVQFKNWAEIGVGVGFHRSGVQFYSASDKHKVGIASTPTYLTATIYPYHDDNRAFYLKGTYGLANSISGSKNTKDKAFSSRVIQGGVGYKYFMNGIDRFMYVELSQYYSSAKGTYKDPETYNAEIDYNLQFYGVVLSVGINLNRF